MVTLLAGNLHADEPSRDSAKQALRKVLDESVGWYELFAVGDQAQPMKPLAVLRWTHHPRGVPDGVTVLWIHKGRPEAVACIYPFGGRLYHWFNSMSRGEIRRGRSGGWWLSGRSSLIRPTAAAPRRQAEASTW